MEFCVNNAVYSITAIADTNGFILRSLSNGTLVAERQLPGTITGMTLDNNTLFCVVEYDAKAEYRYGAKVLHSFGTRAVQLQTYNMKLEELSSSFETSSVCQHLLSCMDETAVYTVQWDVGSTGIEDGKGVFRPFDEVVVLTLSRHDLKTYSLTTWKLDDFGNNNECREALEKVVDGYITGISRIHAANGKLIFECDVFEPNSVIENDDPDFDENELSEADYVEYHSFPCTICADLDAKELSCVANN